MGYWLVASDGGIFSFGDAKLPRVHGRQTAHQAHRRYGGHPRRQWATGSSLPMAASSASATPSFHGSMGGKPLNKPIVGMAATPDGNGYWLVASDGGIFQLRRRRLPRVDGRQASSTGPWWASPPLQAARAIGSLRPTEGSSPSTPPSTDPWAASRSAHGIVGIASAPESRRRLYSTPPTTTAPPPPSTEHHSFVASSTLPAERRNFSASMVDVQRHVLHL